MRYIQVNRDGKYHADTSCRRLGRSDRRRSFDRYGTVGDVKRRDLCQSCSAEAGADTEAAQVREAIALLRSAVRQMPAIPSWDRAGNLLMETARLRKHLAHLTAPLREPLEHLAREVLGTADTALHRLRSVVGIHPALVAGTDPVVLLEASYEPWRAGYVPTLYEVMVCADPIVTDMKGHCAAMILPAAPGVELSHHVTATVEPGDTVEVLATTLRIADLNDVTLSGWTAYRRARLSEALSTARMIHQPVPV